MLLYLLDRNFIIHLTLLLVHCIKARQWFHGSAISNNEWWMILLKYGFCFVFVFNWGGMKPRRSLNKGVRPNPFILAAVVANTVSRFSQISTRNCERRNRQNGLRRYFGDAKWINTAGDGAWTVDNEKWSFHHDLSLKPIKVFSNFDQKLWKGRWTKRFMKILWWPRTLNSADCSWQVTHYY